MEVDSWTQEQEVQRRSVMVRRMHWGALATANQHSDDKDHFALLVLATESNNTYI